MEKERRLDPDVLLADIEKEDKGKLTIFLGAAAGVGKTYAMLLAAKERVAEGMEVVVGLVETHGRIETEAVLQGLTSIPPRILDYRGKKFQELDLDALLEREPELALVDELAHTNVPGSRHAKRYQDVEELLTAGINVYTTLNIQHLETLNDIVAQITGVTVRETVPDRILESAYQIKLVDIPPEDLIQRLKEGKVYVPGQASEAMRNFFRPGNISALRELALRYTAKRVDRQVESYMRVHGIEGPWPAAERVLVCVSQSPFSAQLIREARRIAERLNAEWIAAYVNTPRRFPNSEIERDRIARHLRLAEQLGADTVTIAGNDVAEEILELARARNVSQIIIGKPRHARIWDWIRGSVVDKVIRHGLGISVHVIPGTYKHSITPDKPNVVRQTPWIRPYLISLVAVFVLTLLMTPVRESLGLVNVAMIYLLPVLFSAAKWGIGPALVTSAAGVISFDLFFVPPRFSFTVDDLRYLVSFVIVMLVGVITGTLSSRLKKHLSYSRQREARVSSLYALSRDIVAVSELESVVESIVHNVSDTIEGQVILLLPGKNRKLVLTANSHPNNALTDNDLAVATWVFEQGQKAGKGTETLGAANGLYYPLIVEQRIQGVLGIILNNYNIQPEQLRVLEAFVGLAAMAVNRIKLAEQAREAITLAQSERLRTALFNSLSHDLRTPLASIIGAVTSLIEEKHVIYTPEARRDLLQTILQGAERMNRFVNNLLDMARLESGMLKLNKDWCDIQDIIGVAVSRLNELVSSRPLKVDIQSDLPLVMADFILIEQVVVNLLDNALKYSNPDSEIGVTTKQAGKTIEISVLNMGNQIPEEDLGRVFDKFYRLNSPLQVSGSGLGLAICKGIVEVHGGRIWADNTPQGGVKITFTIPLDLMVQV